MYIFFFVFVIIKGSKMYKHMGKVVIKILQGSAVHKSYYSSPSCKFLIVYMPKIMKISCSRQKYCNKQAYFLAHPVHVLNAL